MFDALKRLLSPHKNKLAFTNIVLTTAMVGAHSAKDPEVDVVHIVDVLIEIPEMHAALERAGLEIRDVRAVVGQLVESAEVSEGNEPRWSATVDEIRATLAGTDRPRFEPFLVKLASVLPRELAFTRAAFISAAGPVGAQLDVALGANESSGLTFEGWVPELKASAGLMQRIGDDVGAWTITPEIFLLSIFAVKSFHDAFAARGVDSDDITDSVNDHSARSGRSKRVRQKRPPEVSCTVGARLYAALVRAERLAGEDRSEVRLRHILEALHAEPALAPIIERLIR